MYSVSNQVLGQTLNPHLRKCDNVLPGQGYCTPQEAMIYWYGAVLKILLARNL
jgi:hypothetical protein